MSDSPNGTISYSNGVFTMSLDRSLKGKSTLERHRNVLRRMERIVLLEDNEKWTESKSSVFGLVKVGHRKQAAAKKAAKTEVEGAVATPAGGKAAAPAAGAKAAAPAAKTAAKK
jgi:small basic protein (TIGR04137 family)